MAFIYIKGEVTKNRELQELFGLFGEARRLLSRILQHRRSLNSP